MSKPLPPSAPTKKALQIRVDSGLHERLTTAADQMGVSFNSLAEGILAWAMQEGNYHTNETARECYDHGPAQPFIGASPLPGAIWFGTREEWHEVQTGPYENDTIDEPVPYSGTIHFSLDFTPQSHIRIPPPPPRPKSTLRLSAENNTEPQPVSPPKPSTPPKPKRKHP